MLLLALCVASLHLRAEHISASLPYPQHIDESAIALRAGRMLKTGDFHPSPSPDEPAAARIRNDLPARAASRPFKGPLAGEDAGQRVVALLAGRLVYLVRPVVEL